MKIIGLTGTNGAGKGTIVEYLKNKGFVHYSVSGFLRNIIKEQGLPINRDSMGKVSDELRKKFGPGYLVEELYKLAEKNGKDCIIESIRTLGEIESLHKQGNFSLWAIDADQKIRYERITLRGSEKDDVSFEKFQEQEKSESANLEAHKKNLFGCIKKADVLLNNNGTVEELHQQIDKLINLHLQ
ncbi:MAG: hypothetical protein CR971_01540 [candidate division SR1 bacterium]|nr:MAG: hypothetical protein CR971_01540 [candidate division SR1 bacterium]